VPEVLKPPPGKQRFRHSQVATGCRRDGRTQLTNLGDLVGGEDLQRFRAGRGRALPQGRLAPSVSGDPLILADSFNEFRDAGPNCALSSPKLTGVFSSTSCRTPAAIT
jgi:hypothetical protein